VTVIVFRDGVMAADTRLSDFNSASKASKLVRLQDGGVAGGCGHWSAAYAALKWLAEGGSAEGSEDRKILPDIDGSSVLIARPDGSLWLLENRFPAFPLLDRCTAIGCGSDAAKMAMALGKTAPEAVSWVTRQDLLCGDPVQSMEVEPTHEYGPIKTHRKGSR